jgi:hypothetical protein
MAEGELVSKAIVSGKPHVEWGDTSPDLPSPATAKPDLERNSRQGHEYIQNKADNRNDRLDRPS